MMFRVVNTHEAFRCRNDQLFDSEEEEEVLLCSLFFTAPSTSSIVTTPLDS